MRQENITHKHILSKWVMRIRYVWNWLRITSNCNFGHNDVKISDPTATVFNLFMHEILSNPCSLYDVWIRGYQVAKCRRYIKFRAAKALQLSCQIATPAKRLFFFHPLLLFILRIQDSSNNKLVRQTQTDLVELSQSLSEERIISTPANH
jgi:hypothetical protein